MKQSMRKYEERKRLLAAADGPAERIRLLLEWLTDRLEQHEVFGNEVGNAPDYYYLCLCRDVLKEAEKHIEE